MMIIIIIIMFIVIIGRPAAGRGVGMGDATVGSPRRARIDQFESFEFILLLKLHKQFPVNNSRQQYLSQQYAPPPL